MSEPLTPARLAELDALYAAMTPGKWFNAGTTEMNGEGGFVIDSTDGDGSVASEGGVFRGADADGIVALHSDYPALSAALRAAWDRELKWSKDVDRLKDERAAMEDERDTARAELVEAVSLAARVAELEAELATVRKELADYRDAASAEAFLGDEARTANSNAEFRAAVFETAADVAYAERDTLADRLREAVELLRPFATWARNIAEIDPVARPAYEAAAAFLASEAAK